MKPKFIYVFDPLCGWCYSFSPVVKKIHDYYQEAADFSVLSGGMRVGSNVGPIYEMAPIINPGMPRIKELTGVEFGSNFKELLQEGSYRYDSEPACIALTVFKEINEKDALAFASDMQKALFY
ncbi:DsbA family protein, partial [Xanthovirga aplysinae]|uniref:DsbA family protein n=1 Tax=Xanthovirga aplysinae TaxID=2529853 RepID=UPI003CCD3439|nr:DsbA family protein [Xanthovirga aplysinae]